MRIAHLHQETREVQCGLYACSPAAAGFRATFDSLTLYPVKGEVEGLKMTPDLKGLLPSMRIALIAQLGSEIEKYLIPPPDI